MTTPTLPLLVLSVSIPAFALQAPRPASSPGPAVAFESLEREGVSLELTAADRDEAGDLATFVARGREEIEAFAGTAFPKPFVVRVFPSRAALTAAWSREWNVPDLKAECWMVASGTAKGLTLLSPRVWKTEACEHDAADRTATQKLVTHELTHTFHGQSNPSPEFDGLEEIGWFVEGVATFTAGQVDERRLAAARKAVAEGKAPATLARVWSGPNRYGFAGSLAGWIDGKWGRKTTLALLRETKQSEILARLGMTEDELLAAWKASLGASPK